MSVSEPDADRAAAASPADRDAPRKRRFARRSRESEPAADIAPAAFVPTAAAPGPPSGWHGAGSPGDAWSHESETRRFAPSAGSEAAAPASPASATPGWPAVATRAFEETVPARIPEGLARITNVSRESRADALTPAPEAVDDALANLAKPSATPRRIPGTPSVPPPGFRSSGTK
jgi:hypothetical protein